MRRNKPPRIIRVNELTGTVTYAFDAYDVNGKRHQSNVTCKRSEWKNRFRQWLDSINAEAEKGNTPMLFETMREYLQYARHVKAPQLLRHESSVIERFLPAFLKNKDMPLEEFDSTFIEDYKVWRRTACFHKDHMKERVSDATINRDLSTISYFFNWAIKRRLYRSVNPVFKTKISEHGLRRWLLTEDQVMELLDKAFEQDTRLYTLVRIALSTAMRFGEIMSLHWRDIDFVNNRINIHWKRTKGKEPRSIPMIPTLQSFLRQMKGGPNEKVIRASYNAMQIQSKRLRPALSFFEGEDGNFHFHDIRHVAGQIMYDEGVDISDIQRIMGHKDIQTTLKHYVHFARRDLAVRMAKMDNVLPLRLVSNQ